MHSTYMSIFTRQYHTYIIFCFFKKDKIKFVYIIFCSLISDMEASKQLIFEMAYFLNKVIELEFSISLNQAKKIQSEMAKMSIDEIRNLHHEIKEKFEEFEICLFLTGSKKTALHSVNDLIIGKIKFIP